MHGSRRKRNPAAALSQDRNPHAEPTRPLRSRAVSKSDLTHLRRAQGAISLYMKPAPVGLRLAGLATIRSMGRPQNGMTRRSLCLSALAAGRLLAEGRKGEILPSDAENYSDPLTELEVYRLTQPEYSSRS